MTCETPPIGPPWSFSKIKTFDCPWRGYLRYGEDRPEPPTETALLGKLAHALLSLYRERHLQLDARLSASSLAIEARSLEPDDDVRDKTLEIVAGAVNHLPLLPRRDQVVEYWIEERFALDDTWHPVLFEDDRAFFRGVVDFAWLSKSDMLLVEDDKLNGAHADPVQVQGYAFLLCKALSLELNTITVGFNKLIPRQRDFTTTGWGEVRDVADWVRHEAGRITALRRFDPIPGPSCDYCGFKLECPEVQRTARELAVREATWELRDLAGARKAVQFLSLAEAYVDIVRDELRRWVETNGPVAAAGRVAELRPAEAWTGDTESIVAALLEQGIPRELLWKHLGMTKTAVKKLLKEAGRLDLLAGVLAHGQTTQEKPRFSLWKDRLAA